MLIIIGTGLRPATLAKCVKAWSAQKDEEVLMGVASVVARAGLLDGLMLVNRQRKLAVMKSMIHGNEALLCPAKT
jgi:hypothetical protein